MSKVNITNHANIRFKERTNFKTNKFLSQTKLAYKNGLRTSEIECPWLKKYFFVKGKNKIKKYYKGYIYLFNKTSKNLITIIEIKNEKHLKIFKEIWIEKRKKR